MLTFLPQNYCVIEADLEVKLPTHGQMQQQVQEKSEEKESVEKKITLREKDRKGSKK